ncbi:sialate O-acetylesterase [Dyadobacter helix]|uniref:sialate O-acetylesterase n=1 Tax=Dyadobacter helix TaxID=2822344 RepID=UPI001BFC0D3D|nr:sialate O-acetylesterase [Dyadobacter sp. CECT 9275]
MKAAQKYGTIRAILWHQGEQDSNPEAVKSYEQKLAAFFQRLRKDLHTPDTPILIGTLADFYIPANPEAATINQIIRQYVATKPNVYLVSATGLTDKGDAVHFDTPSACELGRRYAQALLLTHKKSTH